MDFQEQDKTTPSKATTKTIMDFLDTVVNSLVGLIKEGRYETDVLVLFPALKTNPFAERSDKILSSLIDAVAETLRTDERMTKSEIETLRTDYHLVASYANDRAKTHPFGLSLKFMPNEKMASFRKTARKAGCPLKEVCDGCREFFKTTYKCGGCKSVRYCGAECAKNHWKSHKKDCKKTTTANKL
tara:strand:+ start:282 stop:839 length:558 start_codon:yes stop_codon:yes gene_type:complete